MLSRSPRDITSTIEACVTTSLGRSTTRSITRLVAWYPLADSRIDVWIAASKSWYSSSLGGSRKRLTGAGLDSARLASKARFKTASYWSPPSWSRLLSTLAAPLFPLEINTLNHKPSKHPSQTRISFSLIPAPSYSRCTCHKTQVHTRDNGVFSWPG